MRSKEIITVPELIVMMNESEDHHDVIVAFTDYLKGLKPYQITVESLVELGKAIDNHLRSINHWERCPKCTTTTSCVPEKDPTDIVPSIYSL